MMIIMIFLPEQQYNSLKERAEVVVSVYLAQGIQLDVTKHLENNINIKCFQLCLVV